MAFTLFTTLCDHHDYLVPKHVHHPQGDPVPSSSHSPLPLPQPLATTNLPLTLGICLFWTFPRNGIIHCVTVCVWLLSLSIMFQGSSKLQCVSDFHSFSWLNNIPFNGCDIFCSPIHKSTGTWVVLRNEFQMSRMELGGLLKCPFPVTFPPSRAHPRPRWQATGGS